MGKRAIKRASPMAIGVAEGAYRSSISGKPKLAAKLLLQINKESFLSFYNDLGTLGEFRNYLISWDLLGLYGFKILLGNIPPDRHWASSERIKSLLEELRKKTKKAKKDSMEAKRLGMSRKGQKTNYAPPRLLTPFEELGYPLAFIITHTFRNVWPELNRSDHFILGGVIAWLDIFLQTLEKMELCANKNDWSSMTNLQWILFLACKETFQPFTKKWPKFYKRAMERAQIDYVNAGKERFHAEDLKHAKEARNIFHEDGILKSSKDGILYPDDFRLSHLFRDLATVNLRTKSHEIMNNESTTTEIASLFDIKPRKARSANPILATMALAAIDAIAIKHRRGGIRSRPKKAAWEYLQAWAKGQEISPGSVIKKWNVDKGNFHKQRKIILAELLSIPTIKEALDVDPSN